MSEWARMTLVELTAAIAGGQLSPSEALQAHLARIDEVNPQVNAVVTLDPERARRQARAADDAVVRARRDGSALPPLTGVPMTHKDTLATAGMRTTLGSPLFADHVPDRSALLIERLQRAGVITTGKNNVPEFAAGSHTFNPVFGTTYNPYDLSRSAAGSSGGAAAAIAVGIQPAGDGSDTGGSLRTPGSFNNLVGYRPSHGRIPMAPTKNPWAWQARHGFLARTVADIRLLMAAVAGPSPEVPESLPADGAYAPETARDIAGLRIAWTPDFGLGLPVERAVLETLLPQLRVFGELGCPVEEAAPDLRHAEEVFQTTRAFDFALLYGDLVSRHRDSIKDAVVWNVDKGLALTAQDLISAQRARAALLTSVREFFTRYDVLLAPASQVVPFDAGIEFPVSIEGEPMPTYLDWMRAASTITATGLPSLSVPGGFTPDGLPVGLQIVTADRADRLLLRVAEAFEQATGFHARRPALAEAAEAPIGSSHGR